MSKFAFTWRSLAFECIIYRHVGMHGWYIESWGVDDNTQNNSYQIDRSCQFCQFLIVFLNACAAGNRGLVSFVEMSAEWRHPAVPWSPSWLSWVQRGLENQM